MGVSNVSNTRLRLPTLRSFPRRGNVGESEPTIPWCSVVFGAEPDSGQKDGLESTVAPRDTAGASREAVARVSSSGNWAPTMHPDVWFRKRCCWLSSRLSIFLQSGTYLPLELCNVMENIFRAFCALAKLPDDSRCPIPPVNRWSSPGTQQVSGDGSASFASWDRDTDSCSFLNF